MAEDLTRPSRDHLEKRHAAVKRLRRHSELRQRESNSKGGGQTGMITPTPEELEAHGKRAELEALDQAYQWPADPDPHPLHDVFSHLRVHLPGGTILSLDWEWDPPRVIVSNMVLEGGRKRGAKAVRSFAERLRGRSPTHFLAAARKALLRAGITIPVGWADWWP